MCAVSLAVTETISSGPFLAQLKQTSAYLMSALEALKNEGKIKAVRGAGLLLGIVVESPSEVVQMAFEQQLLLIAAGSDTVRILPPLNITMEEAEQVAAKLNQVLSSPA